MPSLEAVLENLDALTISDIYTEKVVTVAEDTHVGQAINSLREHGISRVPVVDDGMAPLRDGDDPTSSTWSSGT